MIQDTCGIHFPQEWKSRLKNFVAAVLFEFNGLVQKTTLDSCIFQEIMGHLRTNPGFTMKDQFTVLGNFLDPVNQFRDGGCVACNLEYPQKSEKIDHPRLTVEVDNRRCFGCHSRSGRISLNYLGLAEV